MLYSNAATKVGGWQRETDKVFNFNIQELYSNNGAWNILMEQLNSLKMAVAGPS
jgi:hypothetical protein